MDSRRKKEVIELSKPEVLGATEEFESSCSFTEGSKHSFEHPESAATDHKQVLNYLKSLVKFVSEGVIIYHFTETGSGLITLDTGEAMDPEVAKSLSDAPNIGKTMFAKFIEERIEKRVKLLSDIIRRPNMFTFSNRLPENLKEGADKIRSAKANSALLTSCSYLSMPALLLIKMIFIFRHENKS